MTDRQSNGASEVSEAKNGGSVVPQRPGSAQSQRRTPQKLGPRKHSHHSQSTHPNSQGLNARDTQYSGQDSPHAKPPASTSEESQPNGTDPQHQQNSEQSPQGNQNHSRRRQTRRRGRGRSSTQTSESETGSVSEVAQGGRRNRTRKKSAQSPQTDAKGAQDTPTTNRTPLNTLDEVGETEDGAVETSKSAPNRVKKEGRTAGSRKKGKGKADEGNGEEKSTLRLRIELDLDLELELKAKIQGAVTLALLD